MNKLKEAGQTIIDAKGLILGRMASIVAKKLLNGEQIVIINAEEAIISGKKSSIVKAAKDFLEVGHFRKGPIHYRRPDKIVKKVVRGMLPYKKYKGKEALKRLRVFISTPEELKNKEKITFSEIDSSKLKCSRIKVSDLSYNIGWKK